MYIIKHCPDGSTLKEDKGGSMAKWSVQYQRSNLFLVSWICFLVVSSSTPQPCITCSYSKPAGLPAACDFLPRYAKLQLFVLLIVCGYLMCEA